MRVQFLLIILTICGCYGNLVAPANAEDLVTCAELKPLSKVEGAAIEDRLQKAYGEIRSLEAEFLQDSYLSALEISESSSGKVKFLRPGKMRWDYAEPEEQQFILADKTMWFYQPGQNQALVDRTADVLLSDLPISFLLGIGDITRDFTLVKACKREEGYVLELSPRQVAKPDEGKGLRGFQLLIEPERALPIGARVVDVGGNITTVLLRSITTNLPIDDQHFVAQFPKGTDIQDRRKDKELTE